MADEPGASMQVTTTTSNSATSADVHIVDDTTGQSRTFTQDDVDRIVRERLARAKATPPPDYDDLKAKAARFDEIEQQSKTELEREREARERAEQEAARIKSEAERRMIEAAVLAEGTRQSAVKPEHLYRLIDTDSVTVGDDGQVTGVGDAVRAFLDANPEYVGTSRPLGSADQGARDGGAKQLSAEALKTMTPEQIVAARKEGRLSNVLAGGR